MYVFLIALNILQIIFYRKQENNLSRENFLKNMWKKNTKVTKIAIALFKKLVLLPCSDAYLYTFQELP